MRTLINFFLDLINFPKLIQDLYHHRQLILTLTKRDFYARFRGSFGGLFWSFFQPLVMMVIYTLVFSGFLKVKFGISDSPFAFSIYLLCGLLPWMAFSEAFSFSTSVIISNSNLVKRVVFPLEILPLNAVLSNTIQLLIGLILLLPLTLLLNGRLSWSLTIVPLIVILQICFYTGLAWIWSSLSVYVPDLRQITSLLLMIGMFLTPIFYPIEIVPEWAIPVMKANPFANLVTMYRLAIMEGIFPGLEYFSGLCIVSISTLMLGYFWFMHTKKGFADVI